MSISATRRPAWRICKALAGESKIFSGLPDLACGHNGIRRIRAWFNANPFRLPMISARGTSLEVGYNHAVPGPLTPATIQSQIDKLLASESFRNSASLRRLLEYLAEHSLAEPQAVLKEYRIGVEVLGKPDSYDPRTDPSVRVQIGRLRSRLAEYYLGEGSEDLVLVTLPKGSFGLKFEPRLGAASVRDASNLLAERVRRLKVLNCVLAAAAVASVILAVFAWTQAGHPGDVSNTPLQQLWRPYFESNRPIIISLGIPLSIHFVAQTEAGAELSGTLRDQRLNVWPTGGQPGVLDPLGEWRKELDLKLAEPSYNLMPVGESIAAFLIGKALAGTGRDPSVARSNVLSWDAVKAANVIFIGAPESTPHLRTVQFSKNFEISPVQVLNLHPRTGELRAYPEGPSRRLGRDAALIGRYPNRGGAGMVTVIGSASSRCTWAAAEYLTRPAYVASLTRELHDSYGEVPRYFEVVIEARFDRDNPVDVRHVAHRKVLDPATGDQNPASSVAARLAQ